MNLLETKESKSYYIKNVQGGKNLVHRLAELGLFAGSQIEVLSNKNGPVIIRIFGSVFAIGIGQAKKIEVLE